MLVGVFQISPSDPPGARHAHLPCLVMIISVWCRWNLSHRGRLHRYTCARAPAAEPGSDMEPMPVPVPG